MMEVIYSGGYEGLGKAEVLRGEIDGKTFTVIRYWMDGTPEGAPADIEIRMAEALRENLPGLVGLFRLMREPASGGGRDN